MFKVLSFLIMSLTSEAEVIDCPLMLIITSLSFRPPLKRQRNNELLLWPFHYPHRTFQQNQKAGYFQFPTWQQLDRDTAGPQKANRIYVVVHTLLGSRSSYLHTVNIHRSIPVTRSTWVPIEARRNHQTPTKQGAEGYHQPQCLAWSCTTVWLQVMEILTKKPDQTWFSLSA